MVGKSTAISIRLPLTLAIIPCQIITTGGERYAIPQFNLERCSVMRNIDSKEDLHPSSTIDRIEKKFPSEQGLEQIKQSLLPQHSSQGEKQC